MDSKVCRDCKVDKPLTDYHRNGERKDGLQVRCKPCAIAAMARYQRDNPDKASWRNKKWRASHKEQVNEANKRYYYKWKAKYPEKARAAERRGTLKRVGMTPESYEKALNEQGGGCAICGRARRDGERPLAVDHDHECCPQGRACKNCQRGLLCQQCNLSLHKMEHDVGWHLKALAYLERHKEKSDG